MKTAERHILLGALIDTTAMLEHYVEGRPRYRDGSTEGQARKLISEAKEVIRSFEEAAR